jgi:putative Mg2+ transporter-C (MgtC) family protein
MDINLFEIALRLIAALAFGGLIGIERQWKQRTAGLRTNALVAVGAASFVIFGVITFPSMDSVARIASYVVSGMGFLGAGVIMRNGDGNIKGINTAATLWCSAAIGMFAGMGHLSAATIVTLAVFLTNVSLGYVNRFINRRPMFKDTESEFNYTIKFQCSKQSERKLRQALMTLLSKHTTIHLTKLESTKEEGTNHIIVEAHMMTIGNYNSGMEKIVGSLSLMPAVKYVKWSSVTILE